ncbi:MAG: MFS transporter [Gammaproteobacteria bacterium]|nr:MFS transporter [Gammaproteobacteria bacterium]MDH3414719.1 MFS transporter [Gammaproteobacteria bacterium]
MTLFKTSKLSMVGFSFPAMPLAGFLQSKYILLMPLYAITMGLDAQAIAGIFFTTKMFDVVTDPIFGIVSDRYKTPWGRRRPWLVLGTIILVLAIYMLFIPTGQVGSGYLFGWLIVVYIGWTLTTVSHTAWALELSPDYDQRTDITGWLQVAAMLGMMSVALTPALMEQFGSPSHADKVAAVGWMLIILLPVAVFICLRSLPEPTSPPPTHIGFRRALAIVAGNWALLRLLAANAAITAAYAVVQSLFVFFVTYTLLLGDRTGFTLFFLMIGGMVFIPVWVKLAQHFTKHATMQLAVLYGMVVPALMFFLPPGQLWLTALAFLFVGAITSAHEMLPRTMMADVCDHDQAESGSERMGLYYALLQLSSKLAAGLMASGIYMALSWIGFDPDAGAENSQAMIENVRYLIVFTPIGAYLLVLLLMWKYPIDRKRQKELRRIIDERSGV